MNRCLLAALLILVAVASDGCSSSKTTFDTPQKITGEITVIGNEPFTKLAVRVENGKTFLINGSEEIRKLLLSHQGNIAEIFYTEIENKDSVDEIEVTKIEFLSK